MTVTLGIDLASQPASTGLCAIEWRDAEARVVALARGVGAAGQPLTDAALLDAMCDGPPAKVAIDAPLGWPVDFVRAVSDREGWPIAPDGDRSRLERRATDLWVHRATRKLPLSVTTDRIAYPAMRAASLLAAYARRMGATVDRSGVKGRVCEVYPDPSIRLLGLQPLDAGPRDSYKGAATDVRSRIVDRLVAAAPWLRLEPKDRWACVESHDCLDALVCALVARAAQLGRTVPPPPGLREEAQAEGWIHLPERGLTLDALR